MPNDNLTTPSIHRAVGFATVKEVFISTADRTSENALLTVDFDDVDNEVLLLMTMMTMMTRMRLLAIQRLHCCSMLIAEIQ